MYSWKRAHRGEGAALLDEELAQLGAADARDLPRGLKRAHHGVGVALQDVFLEMDQLKFTMVKPCPVIFSTIK